MKSTMVLTAEQEQVRKEREQAIESLKYNSMCYGCKELCVECNGTTEKVWSGCIWYKKADFPSVDWLESRTRGEHFKNEVLTDKYIVACKKILNILKEA